VTFREAVENVPALKAGFREGLGAVEGRWRPKIQPADSRLLNGSVDIDTCTKNALPDETRWDYAVGYNGRVHYIEVHPAETSNVKDVLAKFQWLKEWLRTSAPSLDQVPRGRPSFCWVATGKINIPKTAPQFRKLKESGLVLAERIALA